MDSSLLPFAFLLPVGFLLISWDVVASERIRKEVLDIGIVVVTSTIAYLAVGFAFQFGGIGLGPDVPGGLQGLNQSWSPIAFSTARWSFIGLEGFLLNTQGQTQDLNLVEMLALHRLPLAIVAGLIPAVVLGKYTQRVARVASSIVASAVVFPIVGAWIWGAGWLASLGQNMNLGHGAIDVGGSGIVFLASACVALSAVRLFEHREQKSDSKPTLQESRQPLLALLGAPAFAVGWAAWILSDPLLNNHTNVDWSGVATIGLICAIASALTTTFYFWLATGHLQLSMIARGWTAGWIAAAAAVWFIPPTTSILIGIVASILFIFTQYGIEFRLGIKDRVAMIAVCGASGAWGLIALGIFSDGAFGMGWNGLNTTTGVRGLLTSDPGQLTAQLSALIVIAVFSLGISTLLLTPLSFVFRAHPPEPTIDDDEVLSADKTPD